MADAREELARLRPVYDTGVLRMLLHKYSDIYVAILRACFTPLTAEVPQEQLLAAMADAVGQFVADGSYRLRDGEDDVAAARRILRELKAQDDGDYAWVADSFDRRAHRLMCRLTQRAHRAIEALSSLERHAVSLSGAQVNSIIMEIEHARKQLTVDADERIGLLEREIAERQRQIDELKAHGIERKPTADQVADIINVVSNTLRGVPVDLRELVIAERDSGDALRRRMDAGTMSVNDMLDFYHNDYERTYRDSDEGRRFNDAFQVMYAPESREQLDDALDAIAHSEWLHGDADDLMAVVAHELEDIYAGIDAVRDQQRVTDDSVKLLVRQQTDMRFRTMSRQLSRLFAALGRHARSKERFDCATGDVTLPTLPMRVREATRSARPPALRTPDSKPEALDLDRIVAIGGPRIARMVSLVAAHPVHDGDLVDIAASFNTLDATDRRESELVGFLSYLASDGDGDGWSDWHCVGLDGSERTWRTRPLLVSDARLNDFLEET